MEFFFGKNQFPVIVSFIICGIVAGIIYDLFKIKRKILGSHCVVLFIDDLIFTMICTVLFTFNAFAMNDGNYKWYEIPFMICGFALYRKTVSRLVIGICFRIIDAVKKLIYKTVIKPLKKALTVSYRTVNDFSTKVSLYIYCILKKRKMCRFRF